MLAEPLMQLASAGGAAIVGAAATDAWHGARSVIVRLMGRGDAQNEQRTAAQLDRIPSELEAASGADLEQVRSTFQDRWKIKLIEILEENPGIAQEIQQLVEDVRAASMADRPSFVQNNTAYNGGVQNITQHGDIFTGDPRSDR